jgi:hypothetical protein
MVADGFIKPFEGADFIFFLQQLGLRQPTNVGDNAKDLSKLHVGGRGCNTRMTGLL